MKGTIHNNPFGNQKNISSSCKNHERISEIDMLLYSYLNDMTVREQLS